VKTSAKSELCFKKTKGSFNSSCLEWLSVAPKRTFRQVETLSRLEISPHCQNHQSLRLAWLSRVWGTSLCRLGLKKKQPVEMVILSRQIQSSPVLHSCPRFVKTRATAHPLLVVTTPSRLFRGLHLCHASTPRSHHARASFSWASFAPKIARSRTKGSFSAPWQVKSEMSCL